MKSKSILAAIILIIIYPLFSSFCFADGTFIPTLKRKLPDIPIQRAILKYHNGIETLIIEATLDGEGDSFGWIIPVPNIPHRFEKISPGLLKTLSLQTQPKIIHNWNPHIWWLLLLFIFFFLTVFFGRKGVYFFF